MLYFRRSRFLRFVVLPLALVSFLSACHKWVDLKPPIERAFAEEQPESVRLTLVDDSVLAVKTPTVEGDTLFALAADRWEEVPTGVSRDGVPITERVYPSLTVPLDQIRQVEVRRPNTVGTILVVLLPLGVINFIVQCGGKDSYVC
jgi:hypothetical protein